ncbi:hypothetical protein [Tunturiibacter psychrotolerans]|uniref:hypothetical protein n=1 Tax=Tunturiibacter psychrotolerans TaxID=3069686 RepID=UPI003D256C38
MKSPQRLTARFEARGHSGVCVPMQVSSGDLEGVIRGLQPCAKVRGFLITVPHKNVMFAYCSTTSETSKLHIRQRLEPENHRQYSTAGTDGKRSAPRGWRPCRDFLKGLIPVDSLGKDEEIAGWVSYVVSPEAGFITALQSQSTADMHRDQSCLIELAMTRPCDLCGGSPFSGMWF